MEQIKQLTSEGIAALYSHVKAFEKENGTQHKADMKKALRAALLASKYEGIYWRYETFEQAR